MRHLASTEWQNFLDDSLASLIRQNALPYNLVTPSRLPSKGGVYLVCEQTEQEEIALYVGKSANLSERIYRNHLMGNIKSSNLKRYLIADNSRPEIVDAVSAKLFLSQSCTVRWILQQHERKRGVVECFCIAKLYPTYGVCEDEEQA